MNGKAQLHEAYWQQEKMLFFGDYERNKAIVKLIPESSLALDVGCGGGLLSEGMALRGAHVTGIDMGEAPLSVARLHGMESGIEVDYRQITVEELAQDPEHAGQYDLVTCLEMLEHVPDPASVISACATMLKPGGHLFVSTINRNPKSFLFAIVGAEYMLRLLPKGTHEWRKFIRPSEMSDHLRHAGLDIRDLTGMTYNPITKAYRLGRDVDVNYMMHAMDTREDSTPS
jgi:2-polyprenyl-6-hydroxyphenyl methylase/3-demethylubiquinone-9 3-methyltransferase